MRHFIDLTASLGLKVRHDNLRLSGEISDYNPGLDGREQVIFTENRVWQGSVVFPPMVGKDLALLRSIPTRLRTRAGILRLPLLNVATPAGITDDLALWHAVGFTDQQIADGFTRYADGTHFSDGTGFALPSAADPVVVDDLAAGVHRIYLDSYIGRNMAVGDRFSINAFLYEVEENDDGRVVFSPPLRTAVAAGERVRVSEPHIDVRLASRDAWNVVIDRGFNSEPLTVSVVEAFER